MTLQTFQTLALPRMVRGKPGAWDPNTCLAFAGKLLRFIRSTLEGDSGSRRSIASVSIIESLHTEDTVKENVPHSTHTPSPTQAVWRLRIRPGEQNVTLYKLGSDEVETVRNGEDRVGFLPTWFWKSVIARQP